MFTITKYLLYDTRIVLLTIQITSERLEMGITSNEIANSRHSQCLLGDNFPLDACLRMCLNVEVELKEKEKKNTKTGEDAAVLVNKLYAIGEKRACAAAATISDETAADVGLLRLASRSRAQRNSGNGGGAQKSPAPDFRIVKVTTKAEPPIKFGCKRKLATVYAICGTRTIGADEVAAGTTPRTLHVYQTVPLLEFLLLQFIRLSE